MDSQPGPSKRVRVGDYDFEKCLEKWYEELDDNVSDIDDCNSDYIFENSDSSDLEVEPEINNEDEISNESDERDESDTRRSRSYYGKNKYKWSAEPFVSRSRTMKHNIVTQLPGLRPVAKQHLQNYPTTAGCWNLLFQDNILDIIVQWTNKKIESQRASYSNERNSWIHNTDIVEMKAFLGLLIYTSVFKSNSENIENIFATDGTGRDVFRCVMSQKRFAFLLISLRFDNPADRIERRMEDPAAPVSEIFNMFVQNCQDAYSVSVSTCIDEMLIPFRGRCKFKVYMPNKPAKYGIKVMCLTDARNHYFYNGYIYTGRDSDGQGLSDSDRKFSKPTQSVLRLTRPIYGTNKNVTADNWFSSIQLIDVLLERKLTYVGTLKKNKREIPPQFLPSKSREVGSTLYGFTNKITILSHVPKKAKAVILVSSMHHTRCTDEDVGKPEIIAYYNRTKGGVDTLDEKCSKFSSSRRTRRWPMAFFFQMLDISVANAHIIYTSGLNNAELSTGNFFENVSQGTCNTTNEKKIGKSPSTI